MYPSTFEYVSAESVDEAIDALETFDDDAELLAGGQSLIPLQKTRFATPEYLIDIGGIDDLHYINDDGDEIEVGAITSHTEIERAKPIREHVFLFSECINQIADWPVRNQGTFGGTIAEADPSGDYLPVMQVLNPTILLAGPDGERTVSFDEFYLGMFTVDLAKHELIIGGRLPKLSGLIDAAGVGSTYQKHAERSGDYAIVGVAAVIAVDEDARVTEARISIGAVGPLTRPDAVESIVQGTMLDEDTLAAADEAAREVVFPPEEGPEGDYREAMAGEFTKRALRAAYERATEGL